MAPGTSREIFSRMVGAGFTRMRILLLVLTLTGCGESILPEEIVGPFVSLPKAPSNLDVQVMDSNRAELSWKDNSGVEDQFIIERKIDGEIAFTEIGSTQANVAWFTDFNIQPGIRYFYRVAAKNSVGASPFSNETSVQIPGIVDPTPTPTPVAVVPPVAPSGLQLLTTATTYHSLTLQWTDNSGNEDSFEIEVTPQGLDSFVRLVPASSTNSVTFVVDLLSSSKSHTFRVRAINGAGASAWSLQVSGTTSAAPPQTPDAPTELQVVSSATTDRSITLQWNDNSTNESTFEIEVTPPSASPTLRSRGSNSTASTSFIVDSLSAATSYTFRVRASNAQGPSDWSSPVNAVTAAAPLPPPSAPSSLQIVNAETTDHSITLLWTDNSNNEDSFEIEVTPQGLSATSRTRGANSSNTAFLLVDSLGPSTNYSFRVRALNAAGASGYTAIVSGRTNNPPVVQPGVPGNLRVTSVTYSEIGLAWDAPSSMNQTSYELLRTGGVNDPTAISGIRPDLPQFLDQSLSENQTYCYQVRARNSAGPSGYSAQVCQKTNLAPRPSIPSGLVATSVSDLEIDLHWNFAANVDTYILERQNPSTGAWGVVSDQILGSAQSYPDATLMPATLYSYRLSARNQFGIAGPSQVASAATANPPPSLPSDPTGLIAVAVDSGHIHLSWTGSLRASTYRIDRKVGDTGTWVSMNDDVLAPNTYYDDFGLLSATKYWYRVRAHNSQGDSVNFSNSAFATTPAVIPPSAPQNLRDENFVTSGNSTKFQCEFDVKWDHPASDPSGDNITYQLCKKVLLPVVGAEQCSDVPPGSLFSHDVIVVPNIEKKQYKVTARKFGTAGASSTISVTCSDE